MPSSPPRQTRRMLRLGLLRQRKNMHRACRRTQLVSTPAVTPSAVSDAVLPGTHTGLLRCRELLCTRRHRSLGIPRLGKSPLPVCDSLALTTTMAASQHRCHSGAGCSLGPGPGRPGCVSPCCVQCRRYSARDTSRGNMDQSREPTKAVHASADRRQSSQCPPSCLLCAGLYLCPVVRTEPGGPGYWFGFCCA